VVVFQGGDRGLWAADNVRHVHGHAIALHNAGAQNMAVYRRDGLTYAVTSDLPEAQMISLVSSSF